MADIQLLLYAPYLKAAHDGLTIWNASADLTLTLHTSTYTPDRILHDRVADLSNELPTAGGYTAGGIVLANPASAVVAANSLTAWAGGTAYKVGQIVRPAVANTYAYRCTVAGTSGVGAPAWPTTPGQCVTDNTVEWVNVGTAVLRLTADNLAPAWAAFSAGPFRHVVLSDRAAALPADQPLIGVYTFGSDQTGGGGDFDISFDANGVIAVPTP